MSSRPIFLAGAMFGVVVSLSAAAYAALGGVDGVVIPYQGRLDANGAGVNGDYTFRFDIHDAQTGGTACSATAAIPDKLATVVAGAFNVMVGPVNEACVVGKPVWVSVQVKGPSDASFTALSGRQRVYPTVGALTSGRGDFSVAGVLTALNNAVVNAALTVVGNATVNGLVVGDVIGSSGYRGVAANGQTTINNYAVLQANDGSETLINAQTSGHVQLRNNNVTKLTVDNVGVDVSGRLQRDEYQLSCAEGLSGSHWQYCCRMNVRNGATDCKRASNATWGSWVALPSPYGAGSSGPYSLSCSAWVSAVNYAACCRADVNGHVDCMYNTNNDLNGAWAASTAPF